MPEADFSTPDYNQPRPHNDDISNALRSVDISALPVPQDHALIDFFNSIDLQFVNGKALVIPMAVENHPVIQWFSSRNRLNEIDFVSTVLLHNAFEKASGMKGIKRKDISIIKMEINSFLLPGELANLLYIGGAYNTEKIDDTISFKHASTFVSALCDDRFSHLCYFSLHGAWSKWFYDSAWDYTYLVFNKKTYVATVICFTDTD
jgi:hypothetical protein